MSSTPVIPNFNDTTPTAPSGNVNVKWQSDTANPSRISAYVPTPFDLGFQLSNIPPSNTRYLVWEFTRVVLFPANFSGAQGKCLTIPTNLAIFTVEKNGLTVGTVSIAATGVFTFATSGGATVTYNIGDWLSVITPNPQDLTLADVGFVLAGTR